MPNVLTTDTVVGVAIAPRPNSQSAAIIVLLLRSEGATHDELTDATGWQKHTARATLTRLKKKGHSIERVKTDGVSRYRMTSGADE